MPESILHFIRRSAEYLEKKDVDRLKHGLLGVYVLYQEVQDSKVRYDVRYIGMSTGGMRSRLRSHRRSKRKSDEWTHFSVFEVWDSVTNREIQELEGLARHIYRRDPTAST
jgi:hypothetical protein